MHEDITHLHLFLQNLFTKVCKINALKTNSTFSSTACVH